MAHDDDKTIRREDDPARELDCERCEPLLSSYLLEELPPPEREQVGSHLGECGKCRDELDLLKATAEAVAKSPPPGDVPASVERETLLRKARSYQRAPTPLWWAAAAAAALVVAGTSIAIYQAGGPDRENGDPDVLALRDSEGIPANDLRSRSRFGLEQVGTERPAQTVPGQTVPVQTVPPQTVPPQTVPPRTVPPQTVPPRTVPPQTVPPQTVPPRNVSALHPAPAPAKPGEAAGGRKAGPQTGIEEKEAADAFPSWPILAKTNEDGSTPTPESRALKLAPARAGASPRSPFGAAGGADAARDLVFERAPTVQRPTDPAQGASLATGPTPGKLPAVRREREQEALFLSEEATREARRRVVTPGLGVQAAAGQSGGVRFGGGQGEAAGPGAAEGLAGVPGGGAAPRDPTRQTGLESGRRMLTGPSPENNKVEPPLLAGGNPAVGNARAAGGFVKEWLAPRDGRWKERVDDIFTQLDRQPGETPEKMFFRYWATNPFQEAALQPLSTFSADVDTASYTIFRNYLYSSGVLPPREAIRTEEFLNYFKTDYAPPPPPPKPDGEENAFAINVEMAPNPFAKDEEHRLLRIGIKGREVLKGQRRACGLVFVIDTSGSMRRENRLGLVKEGLRLLVNELDEGDTVGIVAFDREARSILDPAPASEKERILAAIGALEPRQNTNVAAGLKTGYAMAAAHRIRGGSNRVILLSDGVANTGNTDPQVMLREVQEEREKGIYLTCVGVGMGNLNDALLEDLADKGDGQCRYVDRPEEAHRIFVESLTGTLEPIARNVKVQVEFDPAKVIRYRLLGYEKRDLPAGAFRDPSSKAGLVGAGHSVTAIYDLKPKGPVEGRIATVHLRLQTIDHGEAQEMMREVLASDHRRAFTEASPRFQLAACVAQAAEVLRDSYWARGVTLGQVLSRLGTVAPLLKDDRDVLELVALLTRADALLRARQTTEDEVARTRTLDALKDNLYLRARIEDELKTPAGPAQVAGAPPERSPEDAERMRKLDEIRRQNDDLRRQLEALIAK